MCPRAYLAFLIAFLAAAPLVAGCGGGGDPGPEDAGHDPDGYQDDGSGGGEIDLPAWPQERDLTCEQVKGYLDAADPRMLSLNVSDEEFYDLGSIPGSLKIPWDLLDGRFDEVDPTRCVVIYCRRGVRSESAYATLIEAGYPHLWVMAGGIERWNELGYPTEP